MNNSLNRFKAKNAKTLAAAMGMIKASLPSYLVAVEVLLRNPQQRYKDIPYLSMFVGIGANGQVAAAIGISSPLQAYLESQLIDLWRHSRGELCRNGGMPSYLLDVLRSVGSVMPRVLKWFLSQLPVEPINNIRLAMGVFGDVTEIPYLRKAGVGSERPEYLLYPLNEGTIDNVVDFLSNPDRTAVDVTELLGHD